TSADPPPEGWRDQLATRLGYRPRRIGILAELALYGAIGCLDIAKENELHKDVLLRVCSSRGPVSAISQVLEQNREDLPLPFSFLQSQASQILPALAGALNWQGDASVVIARNSMDLAMLACRQAGRSGMLLGWVEEENPSLSHWIRLAPCTSPPAGFITASSFEEMSSPNTHYWRLGQAGMEIAAS
ncbi:MAG: hypothetical protein HY935_00775, partial [Nitrosomonadales bacterium]|nr:hypothetical protein [Nitrosomonadales bacterium]